MASLAVSRLRLHLVPDEDLYLPAANKGSSVRGGFGAAFRKLVCVDTSWECADCALRYSCPYTRIFSPFIPPDASRLRGNHDIPRPFVFKPPLSGRTRWPPGDPIVFDLVLVGQAIDYLPYFIVSFRELGAGGFGLNRARARLERVEAVSPSGADTAVYERGRNLVTPPAPIEVTVDGADAAVCDEITLEFLTPTTLKTGSGPDREGTIVRRPAFHHILKRLRDRVNALATFYGEGPLDIDFRGLGDAAERVETARDETNWVQRTRTSRRGDSEHDLSGFVGRATFRGVLGPFLPLLRAGEYVHVGKNAVFGNGWYRLQVGGPSRARDVHEALAGHGAPASRSEAT